MVTLPLEDVVKGFLVSVFDAQNRKNDEASYEKMLKLRRDLSRAVTILEMIKRREKSKRELLHLTLEVFEKRSVGVCGFTHEAPQSRIGPKLCCPFHQKLHVRLRWRGDGRSVG